MCNSRRFMTLGTAFCFLVGLTGMLTASLGEDVAAGRVVVRQEWNKDLVNEI